MTEGHLKLAEFGLIHYNFRGTLEEFLDYASETGFQCTELSIRDIWNEKESRFRSGQGTGQAGQGYADESRSARLSGLCRKHIPSP